MANDLAPCPFCNDVGCPGYGCTPASPERRENRQPWLPPEDVETLRKMERFCVSMFYEELTIPLRAIIEKLESK